MPGLFEPSAAFDPRTAAIAHAMNAPTDDLSAFGQAIAYGLVYVGDQIGELVGRQRKLDRAEIESRCEAMMPSAPTNVVYGVLDIVEEVLNVRSGN